MTTPPQLTTTPQPAAAPWRIALAPAGGWFEAPPSQPLLLSAQQAGITLPSSCRNGTCRTCICRLTAGSVAYQIEWPGLSAEEKADGWILPCVAHPASNAVLHQPAALREPLANPAQPLE